ncbi:hypothetical protein SRB5_39000 [Streptomyces sp. RB5]|uniref:Secreted protein n=1 Tax=Streptomyces smaragdinus TaxID=2585196 RepID=A0A7K0CJV4_9ACTN|nr:hypothetical protein [Streptomyces smaragdinus]MQY13748.1 hypothetical protein [Streptomyces smaragdinus]
MKRTRVLAALAAVPTVLALATSAQAAAYTQPFAADSGDACLYGTTEGTLDWNYASDSAIVVDTVDVKGRLSDKPTLVADPTNCRSDGFNSTATFTAYSGTRAVDSNSATADNGTVAFSFTLGKAWSAGPVDRVVVQVCRHPIFTLPPSYCGKEVTYTLRIA